MLSSVLRTAVLKKPTSAFSLTAVRAVGTARSETFAVRSDDGCCPEVFVSLHSLVPFLTNCACTFYYDEYFSWENWTMWKRF